MVNPFDGYTNKLIDHAKTLIDRAKPLLQSRSIVGMAANTLIHHLWQLM